MRDCVSIGTIALQALRHQGVVVIQGRKYVLHSDVMYSPGLLW